MGRGSGGYQPPTPGDASVWRGVVVRRWCVSYYPYTTIRQLLNTLSCELRRTPLLGTWMNKGKKKSRDPVLEPRPSRCRPIPRLSGPSPPAYARHTTLAHHIITCTVVLTSHRSRKFEYS